MEEPCTDQPGRAAGESEEAAPGSPGALENGCLCSVLLNQGVDSRGGEDSVFVDPLCPIHGKTWSHFDGSAR